VERRTVLLHAPEAEALRRHGASFLLDKRVRLLSTGQGPGYAWDQTPESVEVELSLPAGGPFTGRDVRLEVLPRRLRVLLRGSVLLEGSLCGEVSSTEGDWEWELISLSAGVVGAPQQQKLAISLAKRAPSYALSEQWCCLLDGEKHPKVDTQLFSWTRARPWRPPTDARTVEEVQQALPGNVILDTPLNQQRSTCGDDGKWGAAWAGGRRKKGSGPEADARLL
jgi:hypothetical protein